MNELMLDSMNTLDITMIALVAFSMIIGVVRGFVKEALSLTTWVASSVMAAVYFQQVGDTYLSGIQMVMIRYLLAGVLLSLGTLIIGGIVNYFISNLIKKTGFRLPDRIIGAVFGCARGIFVLIIGVLVALSFSKLQTASWHSSVFVPMLVPAATWVKERVHVPEKLKEVLESNNAKRDSATLAPIPALPAIEKLEAAAPVQALEVVIKADTGTEPVKQP